MQATREFERGRIGNALTLGAAILPLQAALGPYLYAFDTLNQDRPLIRDLEARFGPALELPPTQPAHHRKIAWFSDTVNDVNGVSLTLNKFAIEAEQENADLTIITSVVPEKASRGPKFLNFPPVGEITVPDYDLQKLSVPPALRMIRYLENAGFTEYVISTPGPVGLLALLATRFFHTPCRAIYHNDFPQHVKHITGDESLEATSWAFMRWFYGKADVVYSPSQFYKDQLIDHGFDGSRIFLFNRGTDLDFFNPRHRDERFYEQFGIAKDRPVLVYVGRVSREKNMDVMLSAFLSVPALKERAEPRDSRRRPLPGRIERTLQPPVRRLLRLCEGPRAGDGLRLGGRVRLPLHHRHLRQFRAGSAGGGSARDCLRRRRPQGYHRARARRVSCLPGHDEALWAETMRTLAFDRELRLSMAAAARARAATRDWNTAFREFWDDNPYAAVTPIPRGAAKVKVKSSV